MFRRLNKAWRLSIDFRLLPRRRLYQSSGLLGARTTLLLGATRKRFFTNHQSLHEVATPLRSPSTDATSAPQPPLDPLHRAFREVLAVGNTDKIYDALLDYCARADNVSTAPFVDALLHCLAQQPLQAAHYALINRVLRLGMRQRRHFSPQLYKHALSANWRNADIELMLDLIQHEREVDACAAAAVVAVCIRTVHVMPRLDVRFEALVRRLHALLALVGDHLLPAPRADSQSLVSAMLCEIEEYDAAFDLWRALRPAAALPDRAFSAQLLYMCRNLDTDRAIDLFNRANELGVVPGINAYRSLLAGMIPTHRIAPMMSLATSFVKMVQNDDTMRVPAGVVNKFAKGFILGEPTQVVAKQGVLLLRLLFNGVVMSDGDVQLCADSISVALFQMGDVDGAEQLFKARENWIQVDASVPFFDIDIDPSIESIAKQWLEKPLLSESQLASRRPNASRACYIKNTSLSATIQAQILFDRGEAEAAVRLITRYPVARHDILVQRACNQGGPEAGLKLLNTIERITCKRVQMPATFPLLVWYYKHHQDHKAEAILSKFRLRNVHLETNYQAGVLFNALADAGRSELADQLFDRMSMGYRAPWFHAAVYTLPRWYRENKLERFDALTQQCLQAPGQLPTRLWRTIAALNHLLGDREEQVAAAIKHDAGIGSYRVNVTLKAMGKVVKDRIERNQQFFKALE